MFCLIYVSSAVTPFTPFSSNKFSDLLDISVKNNSLRNITGFMIYKDGTFIQALEGDEADVEFTFDKILNDKRHHEVTVLSREHIEHRNFEAWSMGFKSLGRDEFYSPISNLKTLTKEGLALKDLLRFAKAHNML